jgi:hypothetical protein
MNDHTQKGKKEGPCRDSNPGPLTFSDLQMKTGMVIPLFVLLVGIELSTLVEFGSAYKRELYL